MIRLEGTAVGIWNVLERPCSTAELVDEMALAYGERAEVVDLDIRPALAVLLDAGALVATQAALP